MEFKFNVTKLLKPSATGYVVLDGKQGNPYEKNVAAAYGRNSGTRFF